MAKGLLSPYVPGFRVVAATPPGGFALQNGTPTILSWTAPNDGQLHVVGLSVLVRVITTETGGAIGLTLAGANPPTGVFSTGISAGNLTSGSLGTLNNPGLNLFPIAPGTTVSVNQSSALTAGAATLYAQILAL